MCAHIEAETRPGTMALGASPNPVRICWNVPYGSSRCDLGRLWGPANVQEESGLVAAVGGIDSVGEMLITRPDAGDPSSTTTIRVHVFVCRAWLGDPIE